MYQRLLILSVIAIIAGWHSAEAQVGGGWSGWSDCSVLCGNGTQTRTCTGDISTCPGLDSKQCVQVPCRNCGFWWGGFSRCTVQCGLGGWQQRESYIYQDATPGAAIPCPPRYQNQSCNTWLCTDKMEGYGYYYWKLCPSRSTNFTYTVGSLSGVNLDMFLYGDDKNWDSYRVDVTRYDSVRNYGYSYLSADLRTQNGYGEAILDGGKCYFFVIDYSYVGAATQNANDWDRDVWFAYLLTGNPDDINGAWGEGKSPAPRVIASLAISFIALVVGFFFQH